MKAFVNNWELRDAGDKMLPTHTCCTAVQSSPGMGHKLRGSRVFLSHVASFDSELRLIYCPNCKTKAPDDLSSIVKLSDMHNELFDGHY